jgi:hypothetical protein
MCRVSQFVSVIRMASVHCVERAGALCLWHRRHRKIFSTIGLASGAALISCSRGSVCCLGPHTALVAFAVTVASATIAAAASTRCCSRHRCRPHVCHHRPPPLPRPAFSAGFSHAAQLARHRRHPTPAAGLQGTAAHQVRSLCTLTSACAVVLQMSLVLLPAFSACGDSRCCSRAFVGLHCCAPDMGISALRCSIWDARGEL